VAKIADRIAVMEKGRVVEMGSSEKVYYSPSHEYTKKLISSVPAFYRKAG